VTGLQVYSQLGIVGVVVLVVSPVTTIEAEFPLHIELGVAVMEMIGFTLTSTLTDFSLPTHPALEVGLIL